MAKRSSKPVRRPALLRKLRRRGMKQEQARRIANKKPGRKRG